MNSTLKKIIGEYRQILIKDGLVSKDELIKMLNLDDEISNEYKTETFLSKLADKILHTNVEEKEIRKTKAEIYKERQELYDKGLNDNQIAEMQHSNASTIWNWRDKRGLPPNLKDVEEANKKKLELYKKGYSDSKIAEELHLCRASIYQWKKKNKLPNTNNRHSMKMRKVKI